MTHYKPVNSLFRMCTFLYAAKVIYFLQSSLIGIAIIAVASEDNMVGQREVQEFCSLLHLSGEVVIVSAGAKVARWMIMTEDKAGSSLEQSLP